ncbi:MAG: 16S rRNA (uracil(1498)-N(3))-methyltransferase [Sphaerochaetaceae bacterium]
MNIILFTSLAASNTLSIKDPRAHHIKKILHLEEGDTFLAGVINQNTGTACITRMDENMMTFTYEVDDIRTSLLYPVTLLVAQVRPISMRRILRESVSLGVGSLILSTTDTAEKSYAQATLYTSGEYQKILIDGAMQSGQSGVSSVQFSSSIQDAFSLLPKNAERIVLDNVWDGIPLSTLSFHQKQHVVLAIGGERGFSDRERNLFASNDFRFATLGNRILRTETACSAGIAVLLGRMGLL